MRKSLIGLSLFLASVSGAAAKGPDSDTLVIAQSVDLETLEPAEIRSTNGTNIAMHLWGTLLRTEGSGQIVPFLAEGYTLNEAGTELSFTIRKGLTCEDGEPLTAEDVVYTFNRAADPALKFNGNTPGFVFDSLGFAGAYVGPGDVAVIKTKAYQPIANGLISRVFIHCKDSYEKLSLADAARRPVASGPYRLSEWVKDDRVVLERRSDFTLRESPFKSLVWRVIPAASTRAAELIAGNVDIAANALPDQQDAVNKSGRATVKAVNGTRRIYIGFNQKDEFAKETPGGAAIQKPEVRRALQYAIDVPTICRTLLGAECERATGPANVGHPNLKPYPYDPQRAEKLLDEAGYKRGADGVRFRLVFQSPNGRYLSDGNVAQAVGQYLTDIGVETKVELLDFVSGFQPLTRKHNAGPLFLLGSGGATWSQIYDMGLFSSKTAGANYAEWMNPEWEKRWNQLSTARDPQQSQVLVDEMLQIFYDDPPWLLLYSQPDFYGVGNRIVWTPRRDEEIYAAEVSLKK
ncbi:ABC transporter substrate-binding protein [Microvirga antarctica]|uniref:ABC transporter substrate-binding protein n=1 Tax=Microvirga antarctica TaxID=2819233 RepID=UPI001B30F8CC|nr:ABC transporter substrate-binding protein [Microvirga antarctica]